ncbi:hypothetical protein MNB_SV-13-1753 [hydrothermal vent metagenome]|uniref:Uncharacterized protein n=1 Tax=hydrothermal vent metagenome TaxID=652676 RepID=A0A1W1CIH8_9ZZZZ
MKRLVHTAKYAGVDVDNEMHNMIVNKSVLVSAWVQIFGGLVVLGRLMFWWRRKK